MADFDAGRNQPEQAHSWDVAVLGLGYVGLNLALSACQAGLRVVGIDRDPTLVAELCRGRTVVDGVDDVDIESALRRGFRATMDASAVSDAATVVIAVQTPLTVDGRPDHRAVIAAACDIAPHLRHGALVSLESTVAIGTTDGPVREILEQGGRCAGRDFSLVFAPERINPGDPASTAALPVAGARIGLIGVGYKEGVRDTRNSPAFPIASELLDAGANVSFFDDLVDVAVVDGTSLYRHASVAELVASCDVVVRLQTSSADSFDLNGYAPLLVDLRPGQGLSAPIQRSSEISVI